MTARAWTLVLLLLPHAAPAQEARFPLEPPDRSSPRATLATFHASFDEAWERFSKGRSDFREPFIEAVRCLDANEIPAGVRDSLLGETTLLLKEILDRVPSVPDQEIPGVAEVQAAGLSRWTIPRTEIALVRVSAGEREGQFLFAASSVARIHEFYDKVRQLTYQPGRKGAHYDELRFGGLSPGNRLAALLPAPARHEVAGALVWQWGVVLACYLLAAAVATWVFRRARRFTRWELELKGQKRFGPLVFPLVLLALVLAARQVTFLFVRLAGPPYLGLRLALTAIAHLAVAWLIAVVITRLGELVVRVFQTPEQPLNTQLVSVSFRILTILAVTGYLFFGAQSLGLPLPALVAGFGVGGLAVALATQSTLENLIGGLILYADRPARVGDVIRLDDRIGIVEEIGLRSARIRTIDRTVIAIPNSDLIRRELENLTLRDGIPVRSTVRLRPETTPDQLRYLLATLTRMLQDHPRLVAENARARFIGFGESSLDVELRTLAATTDFDEFLAVRQDVLLRVMSLVAEAGTRLAIPVAVELAGEDAAFDRECKRAAEETARRWREEGALPFPQFNA